jgi:soluble lytic murein transglycosylase-like protein
VAEWLVDASPEDDEWVENIPYDQTRGYVKRVLRSVHAYRVLY